MLFGDSFLSRGTSYLCRLIPPHEVYRDGLVRDYSLQQRPVLLLIRLHPFSVIDYRSEARACVDEGVQVVQLICGLEQVDLYRAVLGLGSLFISLFLSMLLCVWAGIQVEHVAGVRYRHIEPMPGVVLTETLSCLSD